jgi:hypothetical protein
MTRLKDPDLMRDLHEQWAETGCAICSYEPSPDAPDGFRLEMHHVIPRSQGGPDAPWNLVALCGGLTENRCHQRVTEHVYEIARNDAGILVWRDRRAGGQLWKRLRFTAKYSQLVPPENPPAGGSDGSAVDDTPPGVDVAEPEPYSDAPGVSEDPSRVERSAVVTVPAAAAERQPSPEDSPEERASQIRERVTAAKRLTMEAAILLNHAALRNDHVALGVSWKDFYSSLGLERSTVSKMIAAARALGEEWTALTPTAREHVSLEAAYQGALLVKAGWTAGDAIDAVVANPTSRLIALRTGDEPTERCRCTCASCGREVWHDRASPGAGRPE